MERWTEQMRNGIKLDILVTHIRDSREKLEGLDCLFYIGGVTTESQVFMGREGIAARKLLNYIEGLHDAYGVTH